MDETHVFFHFQRFWISQDGGVLEGSTVHPILQNLAVYLVGSGSVKLKC
jgi:hypothetical protein